MRAQVGADMPKLGLLKKSRREYGGFVALEVDSGEMDEGQVSRGAVLHHIASHRIA